MPQMDEYNTAEVPSMTKVAIGQIIPNPEAVKKIQAETEAKYKPGKKADGEAWRRSKNKAYRRKIAQQKGQMSTEFRHERKRGR